MQRLGVDGGEGGRCEVDLGGGGREKEGAAGCAHPTAVAISLRPFCWYVVMFSPQI